MRVFMCTFIVIIQILSKQMIKKLTEIKDQYKTQIKVEQLHASITPSVFFINMY